MEMDKRAKASGTTKEEKEKEAKEEKGHLGGSQEVPEQEKAIGNRKAARAKEKENGARVRKAQKATKGENQNRRISLRTLAGFAGSMDIGEMSAPEEFKTCKKSLVVNNLNKRCRHRSNSWL